MRAPGLPLLLALIPLEAFGVVLQPGVEAVDTLPLFCPAPPAIEAHPFDPDLAFVSCAAVVPGVFGIGITPGVALDFADPVYILPANLNCSESLANCGDPTGFDFGTLGNLYLDPMDGSLTRGWVTTSNCELVVPFNSSTGADWPVIYQGESRRSVPTKRCIAGSFTTYDSDGTGTAITGFDTSLTSDVLRVGSRLLVSTSNFERVGSNPILNPGTVLLFDIDDSGPQTSIEPATPPFIVTSDPNPTALTALPGGLVAVTNSGLLDVAVPPLVTGVGSIDVIDPVAATIVGSFPLGKVNPGGLSLAIDPTGSVAVVGSQTLRALFAVDIRGLQDLPRPDLDPTLQRPSCNDVMGAEAGGVPCLRKRVIRGFENPIALPPPSGAAGTAGFVVEVRFGASGDFIVATSFNDGGLGVLAFDPRNLERPHPLLPSRFGPAETEVAAPPSGGFGDECCPGPMLVHANSVAGVDGSDVIWLTLAPDGVVTRARLLGALSPATGDYDADGTEDAVDNCPVHPNGTPPQPDSGGVESSLPDGVGDPCQCGDVDGDGKVLQSDVDAVRLFLAEPALALPFPDKCNVAGKSGAAECDVLDLVVLTRARETLGPGVAQICAPALP